MTRAKASLDSKGRILYVPRAKTYTPLDEQVYIGERVKVITCLNNSETQIVVNDEGRRHKILITRVYSLSHKNRLVGHASRFVLEDVRTSYSARGHRQVIEKSSKTPHAWLTGRVKHVFSNDDFLGHNNIKMSYVNPLYIAYDPYKTNVFRLCENPYLPSQDQTQALPELTSAREIYCYESGIQVLEL